jgi:type IV pilus assembly protein PilY1
MMMWGNDAVSSFGMLRRYFDTATFGDVGGQLWTLRFAKPGIVDPDTKRVSNWFGARSFQHGLNATTPACGLGYCDAQPFFYITSNVELSSSSGLYRVLNGTGDRFNILDPLGGTCGPDNIRACLLKGCTVSIGDGSGGPGAIYGVEPLLGKQTYQAEHPAYCTAVDATKYRYDVTAAGAAACTTLTTKVNGVTITCPNTKTCSAATETTKKTAAVICTQDSCDAASGNQYGIPIDLKGNPDKLNWFFSLTVFESSAPRSVFSDLAGAKAYDAGRLKEGDLKNVNGYDWNPIPANLATPEGRGWSYYFDHGAPSTKTPWQVPMAAGVTYDVYRTDERMASVSDVQFGCSVWTTLQPGVPVGAYDATTECPVNSPCKAGRSQISYLYGAAAGTGAFCLKVDGVLTRSQKTDVIAIPQTGKLVYYVGDNQVMPGLTRNDPGKGASSVPLADPQDLAAATEWLPVDRSAHACRHAKRESDPGYTGPPTDAACRQQ